MRIARKPALTRAAENTAQSTQSTPRDDREKVFVGLLLTMALAAVDSTIVATAVPSIVSDLGGFSLFAWVFSIYVLAQAVTIPVYGKLADLYGRKPILIIGILIFLGGSMLSGMAWNMVALIAFRGVQGLGAGAISPIVSTIAGDLYSVQERARVQGWLSSVWGIAGVTGPAIGGFFAAYATWRWIFYINLPIGALALYMIVAHFHEDVTRRSHKIDYGGAILIALGAGLFIFGTLEGGVRWAWTSLPSLSVFAAAAIAVLLAIWQERRASEPMLPLWIIRRRLLMGANLTTASIGLLSIGLTTFLPTYAQGVLGVGAVVAGFMLSAMSISWPVSSAISGRLYLRIGFRDTALIGAGICLLSCVVFIALPESVPIWLPAVGSFIMGAGLGFLSTPMIVGIQSVVGWNRRGVVTGANMFARQLGQALGAAVYGSIANVVLANWLRDAPASITGELPKDANAASDVLGGGSNLSAAAEAYIRQGLYLATHRVFWGLAVVAVFCLIVLIVTPRQWEPLRFEGEEPVSNTAQLIGEHD
jgi:EmrB/QacA subfamily drug resistance transporter